MQLAVDVSEPKIIGISGPTKAGKTTLASGIARKICGTDRKLPPQFGRDRVERFLGGRGFACRRVFLFQHPQTSLVCEVSEQRELIPEMSNSGSALEHS